MDVQWDWLEPAETLVNDSAVCGSTEPETGRKDPDLEHRLSLIYLAPNQTDVLKVWKIRRTVGTPQRNAHLLTGSEVDSEQT